MSKGISAQRSKLYIATGTGGAKAITGISSGFPAIVTIAGHGLDNGTVVGLANLAGELAFLNGASHAIANVTDDTFALLKVDTTGKAYGAGGGNATPATYTKINGVISFDGFDGSRGEVDSTDLDSEANEFIPGIKDEGKFGWEQKTLNDDPGQLAVRAALASGAITGFKLELPDGDAASWKALVKTIPTSGAVNALMKGKVDTRISGPVDWS
jgi:hypothetical protein